MKRMHDLYASLFHPSTHPAEGEACSAPNHFRVRGYDPHPMRCGRFRPAGLHENLTRRGFLKVCASALAVFAASSLFSRLVYAKKESSSGRPKKNIKGDYDLVAVGGEDPYKMTVESIRSMGGMGRFVKKDDVVVVKPNIAWDRAPEQACTTNPLVVAAVIDLAFEAGAKRVNVFDITCNDAKRCYDTSGIQQAAKEHGANVFHPDDWNSVSAHFDYESPMEDWPMLRDALDCDAFINVPVLKSHGLAGLTIAMKNLMGVCCGNRGKIHFDIGRKLVDITDFISPELTVVDAYRVLVRNGPTGGNLSDVVDTRVVLAATDATLADVYAATLVGVDPMSLPNIKAAFKRNFGSTDIAKANILKLTV
ncbi:MAG: DUF362 domain-containing protein [Candidatus Omnitrophota bacterium]